MSATLTAPTPAPVSLAPPGWDSEVLVLRGEDRADEGRAHGSEVDPAAIDADGLAGDGALHGADQHERRERRIHPVIRRDEREGRGDPHADDAHAPTEDPSQRAHARTLAEVARAVHRCRGFLPSAARRG